MKKEVKFLLVGIVIAAIIYIANIEIDLESSELIPLEKVGLELGETEVIVTPELSGIAGWINTEPFLINDLKGSVVLVDFWTYTCINCIRTLPYLKAWDEKYRDAGLIIVGVHTPEFEFEKDIDNVKATVEQHEIKYAVVQDNDFETWRNYNNRYWPHKFLIDVEGRIRYDHIGEGSYEQTEAAIQQLLQERAEKMGESITISEDMITPTETFDVDFSKIGSPEIYLGYGFARKDLGNEQGFQPNQVVSYSLPDSFELNTAYIEGTWKNNEESLELVSDEGKVVLQYNAKSVHIVAIGVNSTMEILLDGSSISVESSGKAVANGVAVIDAQDFYNIVSDTQYRTRTLEFRIKGKGFELFAFTFG